MDVGVVKETLPLMFAGVGLAAALGIWRLLGKIHSYFYTETNGDGSSKALLKEISEGIRENTQTLQAHHAWSQRQLRDIRRRLPPPP